MKKLLRFDRKSFFVRIVHYASRSGFINFPSLCYLHHDVHSSFALEDLASKIVNFTVGGGVKAFFFLLSCAYGMHPSYYK
jgi:hypothetical protein